MREAEGGWGTALRHWRRRGRTGHSGPLHERQDGALPVHLRVRGGAGGVLHEGQGSCDTVARCVRGRRQTARQRTSGGPCSFCVASWTRRARSIEESISYYSLALRAQLGFSGGVR